MLLRREGWPVSVSMVGRILTSLPQRGALRAPGVFRVKRRRGTAGRPWALRKPKDYAVEAPGDLVQLDTMDLRPTPNVVLKQFTARDVVSRWDVIEVHHRATSTAAPLFLDTLQRRLPFPLRAIQVDGGSEFAALFEAAYQQRGLRLFVLPPRSPKLNGRVERANRTHTEEFYEIHACSLPITQLNRELEAWERTYNTVRPHQALGWPRQVPPFDGARLDSHRKRNGRKLDPCDAGGGGIFRGSAGCNTAGCDHNGGRDKTLRHREESDKHADE